MRHKLLFYSFWMLVVVGILHLLGTFFYFDWTIWWFDNLVHFLASLGLGFFVLWGLFESGAAWKKIPDRPKAILISFIAMLIIGGVWEIFEYMNNLTQSSEGYRLDTIHDLMADGIGGLLAGFIASERSYE